MRSTAILLATIALALPATATAKPEPRAEVAQKLNRVLAHTPMSGTGYALEAAGWRYRISPYFIAAIAATESSLGRKACRSNRYNAWGLASCGSGWHVPHFHSWRQAYMFMGRFLTSRWPSATTPYHFYGYAACTSCWGRKTAWWMSRLFGVGPRVNYP